VCKSETTLWNSGKEGKEKRMIVNTLIYITSILIDDINIHTEIIRQVCDKFVVKDEDIVALSYPKSGKESDSSV
jgi:hypothetical protein